MFTTHRPRRAAALALAVCTTLLASAAALAQQRQVDIRWSPRAGTSVSFDLELKQRADGKVSGALVPLGSRMRAEGQRSSLRSKAGELGLHTGISMLLQQYRASGVPVPQGQLSLEVDARARPAGGGGDGGGGDIIVFDIVDSATRQAPSGGGGDGGGGDIILWDIVDSVTPVATRIRIDARPDQQLEGNASLWRWFNRPGPGEPLIATIPTLLPGQSLNQMLEIRDARAPLNPPYQISLRMQF